MHALRATARHSDWPSFRDARSCARPEIQKFTKRYWIPGSRQGAPRMTEALQHRQPARPGAARKRLIESDDLLVAQRKVARGGVFGGMVRVRGFWNRKQ